jgi:hypothetical protein
LALVCGGDIEAELKRKENGYEISFVYRRGKQK